MLQPQTIWQYLYETINVINSYNLSSESTTNITFLLTNNHSSHRQFVKKFVTLAFFSFKDQI